MSVGKIFTVTVAMGATEPAVERLDLLGTYTYDAGATSKVVVLRDDRDGFYDAAVLPTQLDRYIVKFYWIIGEEPDVTSYTVDQFLSDALTEITNAGFDLPTYP